MPGKAAVHGVVLFYTSSAVLRAEKTLIKSGLRIKLIPTPREFSSDCGMALRFDWSEAARARGILTAAHIEIASIHQLA